MMLLAWLARSFGSESLLSAVKRLLSLTSETILRTAQMAAVMESWATHLEFGEKSYRGLIRMVFQH